MRVISFQKPVMVDDRVAFDYGQRPAVLGQLPPEGLTWGFGFEVLHPNMFSDGVLFDAFIDLFGFNPKHGLVEFIMVDETIPDDEVIVLTESNAYFNFKILLYRPSINYTNGLYHVRNTLHKLYKEIEVIVALTEDAIYKQSVDYFKQNVNVSDLMVCRASDFLGMSVREKHKLCSVCGNVYTRYVSPRGARVCSGECYVRSEFGVTMMSS